jgi:hypothetical protein
MPMLHLARSFHRSLCVALVAALAALPMRAQQTPAPVTPPPCQTDTIDWVLPGHFDTAVARATAEQRLLLIKGISFGVDEAGATCATKGKW